MPTSGSSTVGAAAWDRRPGYPVASRRFLATLACLLLASCGGEDGLEDPLAPEPPIVAPPAGAAPVAALAATPPSGEPPLDVELSAADSFDPEGGPLTFLWDFGDGSPEGGGVVVRHVYDRAGEFAVTLTVLDAGGQPAVAQAKVRVAEAACPDVASPTRTGAIASAAVVEASGIAASWRNPGVLWLHNDSGDSARIFATDAAGRDLGTFALSGASAQDWEDMAVGPGPEAGASYLFVGDMGDNARARSYVVVYRIEEPVVDTAAPPATRTLSGSARLEMTYPEGASDAECLLVDPRSGDILIVTKRSDGRSGVYRNPAPHVPGSRVPMRLDATLAVGTGSLPGSALVTGGDMARSGGWVVLRTYSHVFAWRRGRDDSVADALLSAPCVARAHSEPAGEAVCAAEGDRGFFTVSEGSHPALWLFGTTP